MEELEYHYKYPHPAVTTDCVVFGYDDKNIKVLLIERGYEPYKGKWAFPGGFLGINETAEDGALRELREETGLEPVAIRQFYTFSSIGRDPRERVISIAYYTFVHIQNVEGGDDAVNARWFGLDNIPSLAFDHNEMLLRALSALKQDVKISMMDGTNLLWSLIIDNKRLYNLLSST